jgi:hypothetical protein
MGCMQHTARLAGVRILPACCWGGLFDRRSDGRMERQ